MARQQIGIGFVGLGNVGQSAVEQLQRNLKKIGRDTGADLKLVAVAVKNPEKQRRIKLAPGVLTTDALSVARNPNAQIVVEVMGGLDPAFSVVSEALKNGKHVVTANKMLLAKKGTVLAKLARQSGAGLFFEASVGGGIPVIRHVRDYSSTQKVSSVTGIVNGTTNFILSRMEGGEGYDTALKTAQKKGFAEADPSSDVDGHDPAYKISLLASLAFGVSPNFKGMTVIPMRSVTKGDIDYVRELELDKRKGKGYSIRYVASAEKRGGKVTISVWPTLVHHSHSLASVKGADNFFTIHGNRTGPQELKGAGAGGAPTGHAVLADVVEAVKAAASGRPQKTDLFPQKAPVLELPEKIEGSFYFGVPAPHKPGELARIAKTFFKHGISVNKVDQTVHEAEGYATVRIITEMTTQAQALKAHRDLVRQHSASGITREVPRVFRIHE